VTAIPFNMPVPIIVRYNCYKVTKVTSLQKTPRTQSPFLCNIVTLVTVLTSASPIHFSHHNIYAPENHHHVCDCMPETEIFQHRQVDETWRTHTVAVGICPAVTD